MYCLKHIFVREKKITFMLFTVLLGGGPKSSFFFFFLTRCYQFKISFRILIYMIKVTISVNITIKLFITEIRLLNTFHVHSVE